MSDGSANPIRTRVIRRLGPDDRTLTLQRYTQLSVKRLKD
ncbi:unnamed protein product [Enterobius vermicularis]|uniref:30S ribosomal protein S18 n=1 Tax=Enterobius vermicularis TaxID=51028 RepID=A0A0N4V1J7_ENTVE|nr:unnamed protein product [Enterobius vermicularis]